MSTLVQIMACRLFAAEHYLNGSAGWSLRCPYEQTSVNLNQNLYLFNDENVLPNVVCKMLGILSRSQCIAFCLGLNVLKICSFLHCRLLRHIAYRRFVRWIFGWLGKKNRKVVPACAVSKIRSQFPEAPPKTYTGFVHCIYWINSRVYPLDMWVIFIYWCMNTLVVVCRDEKLHE